MCFRIGTGIVLLALGAYAQPSGTFTATGSMTTPRIWHTATLLNDGRVLIAGGRGGDSLNLASAEIYDPSTGIFVPTGNMITPRALHTATLLPNGKVLIAGGSPSPSAEVYDPRSATFTAIGTLPWGFSTATLLHSGKVLLAGGNPDSTIQNASVVYDPDTGAITPAGNAPFTEGKPWAPLLTNGDVFLAPTWPTGAELYQASGGTIRPTAGGRPNTFILTANLLLDGKVLVTEGAPECDYNGTDAQLYDPVTEIFTATGSLRSGRCFATATSMSDGTVLISGNWGPCADFPSPEIYNPASGTFSQTGAMAVASRYQHTATLLKDGSVLIAGGLGVSASPCGNWLPSLAEVYTPDSVVPPPVLLSVSASGQGAILHASTQQLVSPDNPAVAGEALEIYGTGLIDGAVIPPQVAIGGRLAEVLFFGKAPGYDKLNQINVRVPSGISFGLQAAVRLNYLGRPSNEVTITVH